MNNFESFEAGLRRYLLMLGLAYELTIGDLETEVMDCGYF
jgi:hypothetical protein